MGKKDLAIIVLGISDVSSGLDGKGFLLYKKKLEAERKL